MSHLSKFSNISDLLSLEAAEVRGDSTVLEINNTSEGFVEKGSDGSDWEVAGFGSERMDHGFESHVDFSRADDFGDICSRQGRKIEVEIWVTNRWDHSVQEEQL